jgi:hypothetical protein
MSIKVQACKGCHDDFYNHGGGGQHKCWSRDSGTMVERIPIGLWEHPPYNLKTVKVPSCWHGCGNQRTLMVKPEALTEKGYWK